MSRTTSKNTETTATLDDPVAQAREAIDAPRRAAVAAAQQEAERQDRERRAGLATWAGALAARVAPSLKEVQEWLDLGRGPGALLRERWFAIPEREGEARPVVEVLWHIENAQRATGELREWVAGRAEIVRQRTEELGRPSTPERCEQIEADLRSVDQATVGLDAQVAAWRAMRRDTATRLEHAPLAVLMAEIRRLRGEPPAWPESA